jgi:hypothetical protein
MRGPELSEVTIEKVATIETTTQERKLFLANWYRIVDIDGSTIAYAPDKVTARDIADLFNDLARYE